MSRLVVEQAGALTLVEDLGRPGFAHLGVPRSGALDRGAAKLANRLVGNPDGEAVLEVLVGGFRARFQGGETWFAITGAWGRATLDGRRVPPYTAARARDGSVLELGAAERGIRYLLAVRGGIDEPAVLGSRSRDTLAGIGPEPVTPGRVLAIGAEPATSVNQSARGPGMSARVTAPAAGG